MATSPVSAEHLPEKKEGSLLRLVHLIQRNRIYGRAFIIAGFILFTALVLPRPGLKQYRYEMGRIWQQGDVTSPFQIPILKKEEQYQKERQDALNNTHEVFLLVPEVELRSLESLRGFYSRLEEVATAWRWHKLGDEAADKTLGALTPALTLNVARPLLEHEALLRNLAQQSESLAHKVYDVGYVDRNLAQLNSDFFSLRSSANREVLAEKQNLYDAQAVEVLALADVQNLPPSVQHIYMGAIQAHLKPNYLYNDKLYEADKTIALSSISRYYGKVDAGKLIVANGQRITPEIGGMLDSLNEERQLRNGRPGGFLVLLGQIVLVGLLAVLMINFLRNNRREIFARNRKMGLLFAIIFLMTALNALVVQAAGSFSSTYDVTLFYIVPVSMAAIMLTVFFDDRVGFFGNVIISILAGLIIQNNFEFFFIQVCAGSMAVFSMKILRRRSQFFTTALTLMFTYWVAYLGYNFYLKGSFAETNYYNLVLFGINVLFTLGTYPLIYLFEKVFQVTSDLSYIELLDTGHPILKELSIKAAGTYQHSMQVANIAEVVATKIGANALQVRVGALFHDIGKIYQPEFFIENQQEVNPHERISPHLSAEIIINHVAYGEELARQHNLPPEVIDFIRTHHGTSRVEYFFRHHQREHPEDARIHEDEFRYKGPKPTTKEMAILMLADSTEAASRSLKNPTSEELHSLIDSIIGGKISDEQLSDARITFRDVFIIKREIFKILSSIYHTRIEYPSLLEAQPLPIAV